MSEPNGSDSPAHTIGFWSALVISAEVTVFGVALLLPDAMALAFLASFFLAPTFVALMVGIHYSAPPQKRIWSHLGLSFAVIYTVMGSLNYYVQLTVVRTNSLGVPREVLRLFDFAPGSVMFAQDMLGYVFMCLATLVAAPVFGGDRLANWIKGLFIVHGLLLFAPLVFPALSFPQDPATIASTNQFGTLANLAWAAFFTPIAILLAVHFRRLMRHQVRTLDRTA